MQQKQCIFCIQGDISILLNKALFQKYQYEKEIALHSPAMIRFLDRICIEEQEEYLKSYYNFPYLKAKQKQLIEYYRYHNDLPRIFIRKVSLTLEQYHYQKRDIRYRSIKKKLGLAQEPNKKSTQFNFKVLKDITLDTSRALLKLLQSMKPTQTSFSPQKIQIDKKSIANLISQQKRELKEDQVRKILSKPLSPKQNTQLPSHRKMITQYTEQSESNKDEFVRKWSHLASHRKLQTTKQKIRMALNRKKPIL